MYTPTQVRMWAMHEQWNLNLREGSFSVITTVTFVEVCSSCISSDRVLYSDRPAKKGRRCKRRRRGARGGGVEVCSWCRSSHQHTPPPPPLAALFLDDFCVWGYFFRRSFLILQVGADFLPGWASGAGKRKGWDRMGGGGGLRFGSSKDFFKMLTLLPGHWYGFHNTQSDKSRAPLSLQLTSCQSQFYTTAGTAHWKIPSPPPDFSEAEM